MKKRFQIWILVLNYLVTYYPGAANAEYGTYRPVTPPAVVVVPQTLPTKMEISGQYYEPDLDGVREYMGRLKTSDSATHQKLLPIVEKMERSDRTRSALIWPSIGVLGLGLVLIVGSSTFLGKEETSRYLGTSKSINVPVFIAGVSLPLVWLLVSYLIIPKSPTIREFVNEHNSLQPSKPLRFQLGMSSQAQRPIAGFSLAF